MQHHRQRYLHQHHPKERELEVYYVPHNFVWRRYLGILFDNGSVAVFIPQLRDGRCFQEPILDQPRSCGSVCDLLHT